MNHNFYVYVYLRKSDLTPYYIGKGKGRRAWRADHNVKVPTDLVRIKIIAHNLYEHEALLLEKKLIALYGRKDLNSGILRNMTDGGDGVTGYWTDDRKAEFSSSRRGDKNPMYGKVGTGRSGEKNHNYGKLGKDNPLFGRQRPEHSALMTGELNPMKRLEMREMMSERMTGKNNPSFGKPESATRINDKPPKTCEHCNIVVSLGNYARWHGINCKIIKEKRNVEDI